MWEKFFVLVLCEQTFTVRKGLRGDGISRWIEEINAEFISFTPAHP